MASVLYVLESPANIEPHRFFFARLSGTLVKALFDSVERLRWKPRVSYRWKNSDARHKCQRRPMTYASQ